MEQPRIFSHGFRHREPAFQVADAGHRLLPPCGGLGDEVGFLLAGRAQAQAGDFDGRAQLGILEATDDVVDGDGAGFDGEVESAAHRRGQALCGRGPQEGGHGCHREFIFHRAGCALLRRGRWSGNPAQGETGQEKLGQPAAQRCDHVRVDDERFRVGVASGDRRAPRRRNSTHQPGPRSRWLAGRGLRPQRRRRPAAGSPRRPAGGPAGNRAR